MNKFIVPNLVLIFLISSGFVVNKDTIIKGKEKLIEQSVDKKLETLKTNIPVVDSILVLAKNDVEKYNASVKAKELSDKKLLEVNKKMLEYDKKENELIKELIQKYKKEKRFSSFKTSSKDSNSLTSNFITEVDSICTKYKTPLFKKKYCVEYSKVYTIKSNGKLIKLKEIK